MRQPALLARLALLAALTMAGQAVGLPQPFTGPFVNAMLVLTLLLEGWIPAVVLGCVTPVVALARGVLPPALGPLLPIIAAGNALFVSACALGCRVWKCPLCRLGAMRGLGVVLAAALVKFTWFALWVWVLVPVVAGAALPPAAAMALTTPQLFTALAGGAAALLLSAALVKTGVLASTSPANQGNASC